MKGTLESYLVDAAAMEAITENGGRPKLLLPHVKSAVKVIEEDEKFHVRVVGPDGSPRMNSKGEFLGIKDFVKELREIDDYAPAFNGTGTTGSGTPANRGQTRPGSFILSREDARSHEVPRRSGSGNKGGAGTPDSNGITHTKNRR